MKFTTPSAYGLIACLWISVHSGQLSAGSQLQMCEAEAAYLTLLNASQTPAYIAEDTTCFVNMDSSDLSGSLIVDVRQQDDFRKVRIPGAINRTQNQLLNTPGLKNQKLLIVDQGFSLTSQARLCFKAHEKGFTDFSVLRGGMADWHAAGRPLLGAAQDSALLPEVNARDFMAEAGRGRVSVLAAEQLRPLVMKAIPSDSVLYTYDSARSRDLQLVQALEASGGFPIVLVGDPASFSDYEHAASFRSLFVLSGSLTELLAYARSQRAIVEQRRKIPERYRCKG